MNEEVLIDFVVNNAEALTSVKAIEDSIRSVQTAVDEVHELWLDKGAKLNKDILEPMTDHMDKMHKAAEVQFDTMEEGFKKSFPQLEQINKSIKDGTWKVGLYTAAFHHGFAIIGKGFQMAVDGANALVGNLAYLQVSSAATAAEMTKMTGEIIEAAHRTGLSFDAVAVKARTLYDYSGLKEGLGEVIIAGEHMNRVFGMTGEEFGRFAATTVQLSDGILTGTQLMQQFDKVVGITGFRMETLLTNLENVAKTLARITGGGASFANSMEKLTGHMAEVSGLLLQMGGDADGFQEIIAQVIDPSQWDALVNTLGPGIAGSLHQMQQAITSGDMDTFQTLLAEGARNSAAMGSGMNDFVRSAAGFDFRQIETLSKLDPAGMKAMADATENNATVMERSGALMRTLGDGANRLYTQLASVFIRMVLPFIQEISNAVAYLNEKLSDGQGQFDVWVDFIGALAGAIGFLLGLFIRFAGLVASFIGTANTMVAGLVIFMVVLSLLKVGLVAFAKVAVKTLGTVGSAVGDFVGQTFEKASQGISKGLDHIAAGAKNGIKAAAILLMLGGAFFLLGAGLALVASQPILAVVGALILLTGALLVISALAKFLIPAIGVLWALSVVFVALGVSAVLIGFGMQMVAASIGAVVASVMQMAGLDFASTAYGLIVLAGAVSALGWAFLFWAPFILLGGLGLAMAGEGVKKIAAAADGGLSPESVQKIVDSLEVIGEMDVDPGELAKSMQGIDQMLNMIGGMANQIDDLIYVSERMGESGADLDNIFKAFFSRNGLLVKSIRSINQSLTEEGTLWGRNAIDISSQMETMSKLLDILGRISDSYQDFAVMASVLKAKSSGGATYAKIMEEGIGMLFGPEGIVVKLIKTINANITASSYIPWTDGDTISSSITDTIETALGLIEQVSSVYQELAVMGAVLKAESSGGGTWASVMEEATKGLFGEEGIIVKLIKTINENLDGGGWFRQGDTMQASVAETITMATGIIKEVHDAYQMLAVMGAVLNADSGRGGTWADVMRSAAHGLFGKGGVIVTLITEINKNLSGSGWFSSGDTISEDVYETIKMAMGIVREVNEAYQMLAVMGAVMSAEASDGVTWKDVMVTAVDGLFGKGGVIVTLITQINKNLGNVKGGKIKEAMDGMNAINGAMEGIAKTFETLAVMGVVMGTEASEGSTWMDKAQAGVDGLFGKDGIMNKIMASIRQASGGMNIDPEAMKGLSLVAQAVNDTVSLMSSSVMASSDSLSPERLTAFNDSVNQYADIVAGMQRRFQAIATDPMSDVAMAATEIEGNLNHDVAISAESGAEVAVKEMNEARHRHEETVEDLLTQIRDGIRGMSNRTSTEARTSPQVATPRMDFANLFGGDEGTF